jgi:PAS domain S-box-containing protein
MSDDRRQDEMTALRRRLSEAEAALHSAGRADHRLLDHMGEGAALLSADGTIAFCNAQFAALIGLTPMAAIGIAIQDLLPADSRPALAALLAAEPPARRYLAVELRRADGSAVAATLSATLFEDGEGRGICLIAAARASQIPDAGSGTEDMLRQLQTIEAVGHLTGGIAHDFNNLLTAILVNLDLLEARIAEPALLKLVQSASHAAERGAKLTQQLLEFTRKHRPQPTALDLSQVVRDMQDMLLRTIGATVRIKTELAPTSWGAIADRSQLELIILNLAINARDAMAENGELAISTTNMARGDRDLPAELAAGDFVRLSFSDTGDGIPPEILARVFEPFFTTKPAGRGSGLGLSHSLGVVKQCGGTIRITSAVGRGTTVDVFLPRASAGAVASPRVAETAAAEAGTSVLVVDDNPDVRDVAVTCLGMLGYRTVEAGNGREALNVLEHQSVDLVLADLVMPEMNGFELAKEVRTRWPTLPLLLMTGYAEPQRLRAATDPEHLLRKPFKLGELASAVRRVLERAQNRPQDQNCAQPAAYTQTADPPRRPVILVVDDDSSVLEFALTVLLEHGFQVVKAESAAAALEIIGSGERIDLMFTDIRMPGTDGFALAKAAHALRSGLRVLYTTGFPNERRRRPSGITPGKVIPKPWVPEALVDEIRDALRSEGSA